MSPDQRAQRAVAVRTLLEDPNIRDAFSSIEAELMAEWKRAQETGERENIWRAINVMERLQAWLRSAASHDLTALKRAK